MISFPSKSVYTLYNPVESSVEDFEVRSNEECDEKEIQSMRKWMRMRGVVKGEGGGANWCNSGVTQHQMELVPPPEIFQRQDQDDGEEVEKDKQAKRDVLMLEAGNQGFERRMLTFVAESCLVLSEALQSDALPDDVEELVEGGPALLVVVHLLLRLLARPAVHDAHLERVLNSNNLPHC